jgi:membrane protease YdiL (CAAX protease family)
MESMPTFRRILTLAIYGVLVLILTLFVQGIWAGLLSANLNTSPRFPWAIVVMGLLLWLIWQYLNGKWWPRSTSVARHRNLRANPLSRRVFAWAIIAGLLSIVALAGLWVVLFQLAKVPGNLLPDFSKYPLLTVVLMLITASLVGAIAEEAGFRGYLQGLLEREVGGPAAIVIASLLLVPGHGLTQGFVWPTMVFYLLVDAMLGVTAYVTKSILPGIVVHALGLLTFLTLVWPSDASRRSTAKSGMDAWLWIHCVQAFVFTVLAIMAFRHLKRVTAAGLDAQNLKRT